MTQANYLIKNIIAGAALTISASAIALPSDSSSVTPQTTAVPVRYGYVITAGRIERMSGNNTDRTLHIPTTFRCDNNYVAYVQMSVRDLMSWPDTESIKRTYLYPLPPNADGRPTEIPNFGYQIKFRMRVDSTGGDTGANMGFSYTLYCLPTLPNIGYVTNP